MIKIDDYVRVIENSPYAKKNTKAYVNKIFSDGTVSISEVDSENAVFVSLSSLRKVV